MSSYKISHKNVNRIALWAVPRSVSTAFERIFIEREDTHVIHEPFSQCYYYGPERASERYADSPPDPELNYSDIADKILTNDRNEILFFKDMASHAMPLAAPVFFAGLTNTFLIRDPDEAIASLYKKWPDFTEEEAGFSALRALFDTVSDICGHTPVVVDATDFRNDPDGVMKTYCSKTGIAFDENAMSWKKREVKKWESWKGWHDDAENSTAILPPEKKKIPEFPPRIQKILEDCKKHYDYLYSHRILPSV